MADADHAPVLTLLHWLPCLLMESPGKQRTARASIPLGRDSGSRRHGRELLMPLSECGLGICCVEASSHERSLSSAKLHQRCHRSLDRKQSASTIEKTSVAFGKIIVAPAYRRVVSHGYCIGLDREDNLDSGLSRTDEHVLSIATANSFQKTASVFSSCQPQRPHAMEKEVRTTRHLTVRDTAALKTWVS